MPHALTRQAALNANYSVGIEDLQQAVQGITGLLIEAQNEIKNLKDGQATTAEAAAAC
tara:strand:- start:332 stop:505 length:174 start_codon:yes stop_codon:yes gene_type:complete